jgi:hypothetical protein
MRSSNWYESSYPLQTSSSPLAPALPFVSSCRSQADSSSDNTCPGWKSLEFVGTSRIPLKKTHGHNTPFFSDLASVLLSILLSRLPFTSPSNGRAPGLCAHRPWSSCLKGMNIQVAWISTYEGSPLVRRGANEGHDAQRATRCQTGRNFVSDNKTVPSILSDTEGAEGHRRALRRVLHPRPSLFSIVVNRWEREV